jgi:hypothetical protein
MEKWPRLLQVCLRWLIVAALALFGACATRDLGSITTEQTLQAYDGPLRSAAELGIVSASMSYTGGGILPFPPRPYTVISGTLITRVDGRYENKTQAIRVAVLPGLHWIEVIGGMAKYWPCVVEVHVESEHVYEIEVRSKEVEPPGWGEFFSYPPPIWSGTVYVFSFRKDNRPAGYIQAHAAACTQHDVFFHGHLCRSDKDCKRGSCNRPNGYVAGICKD